MVSDEFYYGRALRIAIGLMMLGLLLASAAIIPGTAALDATITLNSTSYVSGGTATVSVIDSDMNTLSDSNQTLTVNLTTTTNSTNNTITLTETGANTSIFNSTFTFHSIAGSNILAVNDSDTITAKYHNGSVYTTATSLFDAVASQLLINSTTYGNLTDMNGAAVNPGTMVAGVATVFKINATDVNNVLDTNFTGTMLITVNGSGVPNETSYTFTDAINGTKSISVTDNVAESINVSFNSTSVTTNITSIQTVVPNRPYKLLFNSSMPLSTLGNSMKVNISVADANNNLINASKLTGPSFPTNATQLGGTDGLGLGIKFNLSLTLSPAGSANLNTTAVVINNSNVNTYVAYVNDTVDETVTLKATANYFSPTFISTNLSFLAAVSNLLVSTNKTSNTANANGGANSLGTIIINAQLRDASGNALSVPGSVVTFNSDNTTVLSVTGQTNTTNASGIATITVPTTYVAGTAVITAADSTGHEGTVTITTNGVPNFTNSEVVNSGAIQIGSNSVITATIKDFNGVAISGYSVRFNITTGNATFANNGLKIYTATTASTGNATALITSTNASISNLISVNVTIVDEDGVTKQVGSLQNFTVTPGSPTQYSINPGTSVDLPNIKGTTQQFNITVKDIAGYLNLTADGTINIRTNNQVFGNMSNDTTTGVLNNLIVTITDGNASFNYTVNSSIFGSAVLTLNSTSLGIVDTTITINPDNEPPNSVSDLHNISYGTTYINWTWTDSSDLDVNRVMIYLDGSFQANVTNGTQYYNATNLAPNTTYEIGTKTVDTSGNINETWVNLSAMTAPGRVHNINKSTDYLTIQSAIDNANSGDEIHVDSGTYYENVNVNKQLTLRGIGMPVVDARGSGSVITLAADGIILEGFTAILSGYPEAGIKVTSKNNTLSGNYASNNYYGIYLGSSSNNNTLIGNNANSNYFYGIILVDSNKYNTLNGNNANSNSDTGIYLQSSSNNILIGNNANSNENKGIHLQSYSNYNTLSGNNASSNKNYGMYLFYSSNNIIYNNRFNNAYNVGFYGVNINNWNIIKQSGTNIINGSYLGGNFWGKPDGMGFSQTCADMENDGICDSPYVLDTFNTDYLPLVVVLPEIRFINGTVIDSVNKTGIDGAKVSANSTLSTYTNATGFYSFAVTNGTYDLKATFDIRYYTNITTVSTIGKAVVWQDIELIKKPTGTITGRVTS